MLVESGGNDLAIGKHGERGPLQIRSCVLVDVNKAYGTHYRLADAHNRAHAMKIAELYVALWTENGKAGDVVTDFERAAVFHCGPKGWKSKHARTYWQKIRKHLK